MSRKRVLTFSVAFSAITFASAVFGNAVYSSGVFLGGFEFLALPFITPLFGGMTIVGGKLAYAYPLIIGIAFVWFAVSAVARAKARNNRIRTPKESNQP